MHFVGKDITKFHCIFWPLFLSSGLQDKTFPKTVFNHGHWLKDNLKMSKSLGNVVDPWEVLEKYGSDSVRLYFMSMGPLEKDAGFDEERLAWMHNQFLVGQYVNLLNRVTGKKFMRFLGHTVSFSSDSTFEAEKIIINREIEEGV